MSIIFPGRRSSDLRRVSSVDKIRKPRSGISGRSGVAKFEPLRAMCENKSWYPSVAFGRSFKIVNVSGVGRLKNIDLVKRLNKEKVPHMRAWRWRGPSATILLYKTRKFICVGGKSKRQCAANAILFAKKLDTKLDRFRVTNIVAKSALNKNINLFKYWPFIAAHIRGYFEAEIFPGLFLRFHRKACAKLFSSGKIFITGVLSVGEIESVICTLIDVLNNKDMF